jgi:hypothetical protein
MRNSKTASAIYLFALLKSGKPLPTKPKPARAVVTHASADMLGLINEMLFEASAENIAETLNQLLNEFFSHYEHVASTDPALISSYVFMTTSLCKFFTRLQTLHTQLKPRHA